MRSSSILKLNADCQQLAAVPQLATSSHATIHGFERHPLSKRMSKAPTTSDVLCPSSSSTTCNSAHGRLDSVTSHSAESRPLITLSSNTCPVDTPCHFNPNS